eukprot:761953-Hanusia_phi.AAC.2
MGGSGIAGGLAGSSVSFLLHPLDTLKTMKQADSSNKFSGWIDGGLKAVKVNPRISDLIERLMRICRREGCTTGCMLGLVKHSPGQNKSTYIVLAKSGPLTCCSQNFSPSLAAMTGNAVSSLIFVPKEVLKQRCQVFVLEAIGSHLVLDPSPHPGRTACKRSEGSGSDERHHPSELLTRLYCLDAMNPARGYRCHVQRILRYSPSECSWVSLRRVGGGL